MNILNKTAIAALLAVALVGCNNADSPEAEVQTPAETEVSEIATDKISEAVSEEETREEADRDTEVDKKEEEKKEEENPEEENKDNSKEKEEKKPDQKENSSQGEDDMVVEERDGRYFSTILAEKKGERDPEFDSPFLVEAKIEDDILTLVGSIDYMSDPENLDTNEPYKNESYNFKLSPDVKFQAVGGLAEPQYFSKEEFLEYYEGVKDSGLALFVDVKDGLVTTVSISS